MDAVAHQSSLPSWNPSGISCEFVPFGLTRYSRITVSQFATTSRCAGMSYTAGRGTTGTASRGHTACQSHETPGDHATVRARNSRERIHPATSASRATGGATGSAPTPQNLPENRHSASPVPPHTRESGMCLSFYFIHHFPACYEMQTDFMPMLTNEGHPREWLRT